MNEQIIQLQDELTKLTKRLAEENKGTYIYKEILANSGPVSPFTHADIQIFAGRSGAFKPTEIQMFGLTRNGLRKVPFELCDVTVMGIPQLVNYSGTTVSKDRATIKFFEKPRKIDWKVFGSYSGAGLVLSVRNMSEKLEGVLHVCIKGYVSDCNLIGRG